jgi:hypothetical protein
MKKPEVDEKLTLLTDMGESEAICTELHNDPRTDGGVLMKKLGLFPRSKA